MANDNQDIIGRVITHGNVGKCPVCDCNMTYPQEEPERLDGDEDRLATEFPWIAESFCPNCRQSEIVRMKWEVMDNWQRVQKEAKNTCTRILANLTAANMNAEVEAFVVALKGDHILPMDFRA